MIRAVAEAEEGYFLSNGEYAKTFDELDLDLPLNVTTSENMCGYGSVGDKGNRSDGNFQITINTNNQGKVASIVGSWWKGRYACGGFSYNFSNKQLWCLERGDTDFYNAPAGAFCQGIEKGVLDESSGDPRRYKLP